MALKAELMLCRRNAETQLKARKCDPCREWFAGKIEAIDEMLAIEVKYKNADSKMAA